MSNGYARVVDNLAMFPWETYAPERNVICLEHKQSGKGDFW